MTHSQAKTLDKIIARLERLERDLVVSGEASPELLMARLKTARTELLSAWNEARPRS